MNNWLTKLPSRLVISACIYGAMAGPASGEGIDPTRPQTVLPGQATQVVLSNQDVNRVVCLPGDIDGYKYSEEKGAKVEDIGSEAFIKFIIERMGDEFTFVTSRNEFYFICDGVTYTLLSHPTGVPAQTIFLAGGRIGAAEKNAAKFKPMSEEERAVSITLGMLRDDIPPTFRVEPSNQIYNRTVLDRMDVRVRREVFIEGTDYYAREYLIRARAKVDLDERQFLAQYFGSSIYAVTLEKLTLNAGEVGRVVIVYKGATS